MKGQLYDLTQPFRLGMTASKATGPFEQTVIQTRNLAENKCQLTRIGFVSHLGCHLDAPRHCYEEGESISDISPERLSGRCAVIDVRGKGKNGLITIDDVKKSGFEINRGDFVFFCTGWQALFENRDPDFFEASSLSEELAQWLADIGVGAVGMDTSSVDLAVSKRDADFTLPIHRILLSNDILIAECLRLDEVAGKELYVHMSPMLIEDCDGAPLRAFATEL